MKKGILSLIGVLLLNCLMFGQVLFDFESGQAGWDVAPDKGAAFTSIGTIPDPTSRAEGNVLAITFDSATDTAGQISVCCSVDFKHAPVIGFWVYLPANIPDSYYFKLVGQDSWCWCDAAQTISVASVPKEKWFPIYFDIQALDISINGSFEPFNGADLAKLQLRLGNGVADEAWTGDFYIDNIEGLGASPVMITDFEAGTGGFIKGHYGLAIGADAVTVVPDPTPRASGNVLSAVYDGTLDVTGGSIAKEPYAKFNPDFFALWVYLPADIPNGYVLKMVGQDDNSWSDAATQYNVSDIPKETWYPLNLNAKALQIAQTNFDLANHNLAKFLLEVTPGTASGEDLNWKGTIYVDNFEQWSKAVPPKYTLSDFEAVAAGVDQWYNDAGLGAAVDSLVRVSFDDGNRLAGYVNFGTETKGNLTKDNVVIKDTATNEVATGISVDVYLPADIPDGKISLMVGPDYTTSTHNISDLGRGVWTSVLFDKVGEIADPSKNVNVTIQIELNSAYQGVIYFDNVIVWGINSPMPAIVSPLSALSTGSATTVRGVLHEYATVNWVDNVNSTVQYRVYKSTHPITDLNEADVQRVASEIPQGVQEFNYQPYTSNGGPVTLYFAVTAVSFDALGVGTETELNDQCKIRSNYRSEYIKNI